MTTGVICTPPILQFTLNNGELAAGGSILTQVGGVNAATYQDLGLTTPLPNPIPLNSRGEISNAAGTSCQLFLTPNIVYTFTLFDANGNQIWVATYVNGVQITAAMIEALSSAASILAPLDRTPAEIAASVTPTSYAYSPGVADRYETNTTPGSTDMRAALATANSVWAQGGSAIQLLSETYAVASNITISAPVSFAPNAIIKPAAGVTVTLNGPVSAGLWKIFDLSNSGSAIAGSFGGSEFFPEWWGAKGDGTTDDTAALTQAAATFFTTTRGGKLVLSKTYLGQLPLNGTVNLTQGEYGPVIESRGATLKQRAADNSAIIINGAVENVDPAPGSNQYVNGIEFTGSLTLDMANAANAATSYGIAIQRSYNCKWSSVHVINEPSNGGGLYLGNNCFAQTWTNLCCQRVKVHGYSAVNSNSTITFNLLNAHQLIIDNTFSISSFGHVFQGTIDHVVFTNNGGVTDATFIGGDFEGSGGAIQQPRITSTSATSGTLSAGTYYYRVSAVNATGETLASGEASQAVGASGAVTINWAAITGATSYNIYGRTQGGELKIASTASTSYTDNGSITPSGALPTSDTSGAHVFNFGNSLGIRNVTSMGNSPGGFQWFNYSTGQALISRLVDRPALGQGGINIGAIGTYARSWASGVVQITSTAAAPIYYISEISSPTYGQGMFLVCGDDGNNGFADVVIVAFSKTTVVQSNSVYGAPPTRTYSYDYANGYLLLALGTLLSNNIRCTALENLGN